MNKDLIDLLELAKFHNLYVILCLWNHLIYKNPRIYKIIHDPKKTEKYIENALLEMVEALE